MQIVTNSGISDDGVLGRVLLPDFGNVKSVPTHMKLEPCDHIEEPRLACWACTRILWGA